MYSSSVVTTTKNPPLSVCAQASRAGSGNNQLTRRSDNTIHSADSAA